MTMPAATTQESQQQKRPMLRYLRIAFSVACGILCLLLIALLVRSYHTRDSLWWPGRAHAVQINSLSGHIVLFVESRPSPAQFVPFKIAHNAIAGRFKSLFNNNVLGFYFERHPGGLRLDMPHWFFVLTGLLISAIPWFVEKWRFSLRMLLIAMTLIAVLLGIITILMQRQD